MDTVGTLNRKLNTKFSDTILFLDSIPDAIVLADSSGLIIYSNPLLEKIFGYSREELQGMSVESLMPVRFHAKHIKDREHFQKVPKVQVMGKNNDIFGLDKNGKELPIEVNLSPYSVGNETYVIAVIRDVSDRYWKHARLIDREERLRVLLESTGAIPWAADPITWCFTYVGSQAASILGYPVEHWYKEDFWVNKIHPDDRELVMQTCLEKSNVYSHYELEYRMIKSDGNSIWFHDIINVERKNGKPILLRGFLIDITERMKASDELFVLQQELTHVARVSAAGELTASVAHELNQPLAAIMSNAQAAQHFLQREIPDLDEVKAALADIVNDDRRAGDVINRLRKLLIKGDPVNESLQITDLIVEVIKLVKNDAVNKGVDIVFEKTKSTLPPIEGDKIQLQQVILNIILNAFDAMLENNNGERSLVIRAIQNSTDSMTVELRDNGKGLEKKNINRLFDAFYTNKQNGMGMGLAICRSIITSHGGKLWATKNENGEGATFHFSLPLQLENNL